MHEQFPWNLLISVFWHLHFYQTGLGELEDFLHPIYLWLVYQRMPSPYTKSSFLNLANAFLRLNLRVARVNFV